MRNHAKPPAKPWFRMVRNHGFASGFALTYAKPWFHALRNHGFAAWFRMVSHGFMRGFTHIQYRNQCQPYPSNPHISFVTPRCSPSQFSSFTQMDGLIRHLVDGFARLHRSPWPEVGPKSQRDRLRQAEIAVTAILNHPVRLSFDQTPSPMFL